VTECLFRLQNPTPPKSGVILRSGVLGIFVVQSVTTKGKKHLCSAATPTRAREPALSVMPLSKKIVLLRQGARLPLARPSTPQSPSARHHHHAGGRVLSNAEAREGCINPRSSLPPSILKLFTLTHMSGGKARSGIAPSKRQFGPGF
jgi:hypothetical protein